jgi:hypothetical protein
MLELFDPIDLTRLIGSIGPFDLISLIYAGLALRCLWQVAHQWRLLLDPDYTHQDARLAWDLGFYVLTPFGVLIHELAHLVTAQMLGAQLTELHFRLYWGFVRFFPPLAPTSEFAVAAAGPLASLLLGMGSLLISERLRPLHRDFLQGFSLSTLGLVLLFYPALSLGMGFGDFQWIYRTSPMLTVIAAAVHVGGLVIFTRLATRHMKRARNAQWEELAAQNPRGHLAMTEEKAARLRELEASPQRFLPGVRQELQELRDLRDWVEAHNRQLEEEPLPRPLP